eukprot:TRINITY_DN7359_c2_g1_i2.p1 TRINITY_DN7359_c2_g1~~TRINITY_DN7359_c2_g1_i2.p1  ORF type:complete len:639 (+),score=53.74 TRINITY_DN7359_c2_g1_i2:63-1979(+)
MAHITSMEKQALDVGDVFCGSLRPSLPATCIPVTFDAHSLVTNPFAAEHETYDAGANEAPYLEELSPPLHDELDFSMHPVLSPRETEIPDTCFLSPTISGVQPNDDSVDVDIAITSTRSADETEDYIASVNGHRVVEDYSVDVDLSIINKRSDETYDYIASVNGHHSVRSSHGSNKVYHDHGLAITSTRSDETEDYIASVHGYHVVNDFSVDVDVPIMNTRSEETEDYTASVNGHRCVRRPHKSNKVHYDHGLAITSTRSDETEDYIASVHGHHIVNDYSVDVDVSIINTRSDETEDYIVSVNGHHSVRSSHGSNKVYHDHGLAITSTRSDETEEYIPSVNGHHVVEDYSVDVDVPIIDTRNEETEDYIFSVNGHHLVNRPHGSITVDYDHGFAFLNTLSDETEDHFTSVHGHHTVRRPQGANKIDYDRMARPSDFSAAQWSPYENAHHGFFTTYPINAYQGQMYACSQMYFWNAPATDICHAKYDEKQDAEKRTTVVLMNIPRAYTSSELIRTIDGFAGLYDFLYVPVDVKTHRSLGCAFVNLLNPFLAERFITAFDGFRRWSKKSNNVCHAVWAKHLQGLQANIEYYRNSTLMNRSVPQERKPRLFMNGVEIMFPPPCKSDKAKRRVGRQTKQQQG